MLINFKTYSETNTDPLPNEFVIHLKKMFEEMSRQIISEKIRPPETIKIKWNLTSLADYQLGRMLPVWQDFGIHEFIKKYDRPTTDHQDVEIWDIAEVSFSDLREYYKTFD